MIRYATLRTMLRVGLQAGVLSALVVLGGMAVAANTPAWPQESGQIACVPHDKLERALADRFGEVVTVRGYINAETLMHIYVSPQGSWTSALVRSDGLSCPVASGEHFSMRSKPVAGDDA